MQKLDSSLRDSADFKNQTKNNEYEDYLSGGVVPRKNQKETVACSDPGEI
jgi:hypothetical protein